MTEVMMVISTFPDIGQARQIGTLLVERQLAACVNLVPGVESIYCWKGVTETSAEILAIFKTRISLIDPLERAIRELHPYEVPEIITVSPSAVSHPYAQWVLEQTHSQ